MMEIKFIDLESQYLALRTQINKRINDVLEHGQYILGPEIFELEDELSKFTNTKHCITASSGTDTLLMSLMALDIGPGDEVITSPFTFISTVEVIALIGAKPIFVDIDPNTFNINYSLIEDAITPNTKAIIPVSLYGQCADFDEINDIAKRHENLPIIEDGAQSFGATYKGKRSCSVSTIGSTSFFPSKPLGCYGDGGALFTNDDEIAKALREIRAHGQDRRYHHPRIGINGRMDTLQAAILLEKLKIFQDEINARHLNASRYMDLFKSGLENDNPLNIELPHINEGNTSVFGQFTIKVDKRDEIAEALKQKGIPVAIHYPIPLNEQPAYEKHCCKGCTPISSEIAKKVLSLPFSPYIKEEDQDYIVNALIEESKSIFTKT